MWHFVIWFSGHSGICQKAGLDGPGGLLHPSCPHDPITVCLGPVTEHDWENCQQHNGVPKSLPAAVELSADLESPEEHAKESLSYLLQDDS